jgi:preprotein translocase subunit SecA
VDDWLEEEAVEPETIVERLQQMADEIMAEKVKGADQARWVEIEKSLLLQTLDHFWKEHLATLDALRQVIHLRSFAQKKPIDEYKQEAFLLFERLLILIREEVTKTLMRANVQIQDPTPPPLPDFITTHFDPLSGDDDTMDFDMTSLSGLGEAAPRAVPLPPLPEGAVPESRNALCPCGSGRKFKHCHGALA